MCIVEHRCDSTPCTHQEINKGLFPGAQVGVFSEDQVFGRFRRWWCCPRQGGRSAATTAAETIFWLELLAAFSTEHSYPPTTSIRQLCRCEMEVNAEFIPRIGVSRYNWYAHLQQKRRAVQVFYHPHDPNPNAVGEQRRAEPDSIRPTAIGVGLFCCLENGGDI